MPVTEIGDPRLQALFGASDPRDAGVRPTVRLPRRSLPPLALGVIALVCGVLLFLVLNERRTRQPQPTVGRHPDSSASAWAAPPPLYVPPAPPVETVPVEEPRSAATIAQPAPAAASVQPRVVYLPQPMSAPMAIPPAGPPPRISSGSALVIDSGGGAGAVATGGTGAGAAGQKPVETVTRMRASALANRSMTVPQGTLIPAVLETGFDSTKPGFARAIVSRDVRGFDGKNVLVPRGSRLIGDYHADVGQGQKRAVIIWTRLIRPDGMTIAMDSPAVDTVGRGGVPAHVNSHFFGRLGDALLQSTIGLGSALAQRAVTGPVFVLPGASVPAAAQASGSSSSSSYVPTLTVAPGKSISVFVAHDLDFSAAGMAP